MRYQAQGARQLEKTLPHLLEERRLAMSSLEMAASLGNFDTRLNRFEDSSSILEETASKLESILHFNWLGFYLVNEGDASFYQAFTSPQSETSALEAEIDLLFQDQTFAWALSRTRPVIVESSQQEGWLLLHALATPHRARGMFLGHLAQDRSELSDYALSLLTLVLLSCANFLESFELYNCLRQMNKDLEHKVNERTKELLAANRNLREEIKQRREAESDLRQAKKEAETASRAKTEFLASMSHEVRTPLNGILGMLQLLESTSLDAEQENYVRTALNSSRTLSSLINDLLDYSKMESGSIDLDHRPFALDEVLQTVRDTFAQTIQGKEVELCIDCSSEVPNQLLGDPGRLQQILFNLVGNALKFTDHGRVDLSLHPLQMELAGKKPRLPHLHCPQDRVRLLITVSDTGIGIPEEKINQIFDAFVQANGSSSKRFQGTGLGLGIVRRLVEAMGGSLSLSTREGKGTAMYLALSFGLAPPEPKTADPEDSRTHVGPASSLNILVAEDDAASRYLLERMLQKMGHRTTGVNNGTQALEAFAEKDFDLVFMDLEMPGLDGIEATRQLHSDFRFRPLPSIIGVTAHGLEEARARVLRAGMEDCISKPFQCRDLERVIAQNHPRH